MKSALEIAHEQGDGACVATVFCDDNKKYLSTDLCRDEPAKDGDWTPRVSLESFRTIPSCAGCGSVAGRVGGWSRAGSGTPSFASHEAARHDGSERLH